ncbi:MAG: hypothetical protein ACR2NO_01305 [Chloroflexota bacterium]
MADENVGLPDMGPYARALHEMLRQRSPGAYRAFLHSWKAMHDRGVAERLTQQDDAALRLRIERMILDTPALADLHESARENVKGQAGRA